MATKVLATPRKTVVRGRASATTPLRREKQISKVPDELLNGIRSSAGTSTFVSLATSSPSPNSHGGTAAQRGRAAATVPVLAPHAPTAKESDTSSLVDTTSSSISTPLLSSPRMRGLTPGRSAINDIRAKKPAAPPQLSMADYFKAEPDACVPEDREALAAQRYAALADKCKGREKNALEHSKRADALVKKMRDLKAKPTPGSATLAAAVEKTPAKRNLPFHEQLDHLLQFLDSERCLKEEGLHRKAGPDALTRGLKSRIDKKKLVTLDTESVGSIHIAVDLLKSLFAVKHWKGQTLIPIPLQQEVLAKLKTLKGGDSEAVQQQLVALFNAGMPAENMMAFEKILGHLRRVAAQSETNKMGVSNLATVYGPKLYDGLDLTPLQCLEVSATFVGVMEKLIRQADVSRSVNP